MKVDNEVMDYVSEVDQLYFENNPEENEYIREAIPGEHPTSSKYMKVTQIKEGLRMRQPIFKLMPDDVIIQ